VKKLHTTPVHYPNLSPVFDFLSGFLFGEKGEKIKVVFSCNDYGSEKPLSEFCSLEKRDFDLMTSGQIKYRLD
jgi:hypothetical protein